MIWNKHGPSGNEIRVAGYNGERPVIDGANIGPYTTVSVNESSYVYFTGFVVKNASTGVRPPARLFNNLAARREPRDRRQIDQARSYV